VRDDPTLRGKPVAVAGSSRRAVVLTASYEARPFGVRSAIPLYRALQNCPQLIVVAPDHAKYREISREIFDIFAARGRAVEGPMTLGQFVGRFYDVIAARHEESTRTTQRNLIKNHLLRYFGDSYLDAITTIRVIDFMADMRNRHCSAAYINDAVRLLKMLLRQAVERDVIGDYPIKKRVPKEKEPPLRLERRPDARARLFATFDDEAAFRRHIDTRRELGPVKDSSHFGSKRRFGGGLRGAAKRQDGTSNVSVSCGSFSSSRWRPDF